MSDEPLRIIALSGPKYSGKDTAAAALPKPAFCRLPFAQGVKNICQEMFGWAPHIMEDPVLKETKTTAWPYIEPRWAMMDIANWLREKYGGDVHVRRNAHLIDQLQQSSSSPWAYVITDWRFPEETEWLQRQGKKALKIYIQRDEAEAKLEAAKLAGDQMAKNPSEMHYASTKAAADIIIANNNAIHHVQNGLLDVVSNHFGDWHSFED